MSARSDSTTQQPSQPAKSDPDPVRAAAIMRDATRTVCAGVRARTLHC